MSDLSLAQTRKARPGTEWLCESVFRPLAHQVVRPLAKRQVNPAHVVLFHTALGLYAAYLIKQGKRLTPALLLQIKTILDNADGQLARATGQTTETGRYLDTEMDLVVNIALNTAISGRWGIPLTVLQSLILTVDYLWEKDYRSARGEVFREAAAQAGDNPQILGALKAIYDTYFTPQERLLGRIFEQRLQQHTSDPTNQERRAYTPRLNNHITANLGLSTQLALLGACVLAGKPKLYIRSLPAQALILVGLQLWREKQVSQITG